MYMYTHVGLLGLLALPERERGRGKEGRRMEAVSSRKEGEGLVWWGEGGRGVPGLIWGCWSGWRLRRLVSFGIHSSCLSCGKGLHVHVDVWVFLLS